MGYAVDSLWKILKFGIEQKETLWGMLKKERGVTEISLDATEMGRPLHEALGFEKNCAGMVLELR